MILRSIILTGSNAEGYWDNFLSSLLKKIEKILLLDLRSGSSLFIFYKIFYSSVERLNLPRQAEELLRRVESLNKRFID